MGLKNNNYNMQSDIKTYTESNNTFNRFDDELYDEKLNLVERVFRVKKTSTHSKSEKWRVISDNKIIFIIEGSKISKKEREYLRTSDGFNFLISQAKSGIKSFNKLRIELKKVI